MKRLLLLVSAYLASTGCNAITLFDDLLTIELPPSFKEVPVKDDFETSVIDTSSHVFISAGGTSLSISLLKGNEGIQDLEKEGFTLDFLDSEECKKAASREETTIVVSGAPSRFQSCSYMAAGHAIKQATISLFVEGKLLSFTIIGPEKSLKEIEEAYEKIKASGIRKR